MTGSEIIVIIGIGLFGLLILIHGIRLRLGYNKAAYLFKGVPVLLPRAGVFVNIPVGILFVCMTLIFTIVPFEYRGTLFNIVSCPSIIFIVVLSGWQPNWLLPDWLSFLRQTYGEGMTDAMLAEASKDIPAWLKQVETHEGLVEWADKTSRELRFGTHHSHLDNSPPKDE